MYVLFLCVRPAMRRRIFIPPFTFRHSTHRCKTHTPDVPNDTAAASARLVRSIGFDPDAMESLAHRIATGERPRPAGPPPVPLLLARAVRADPQLSSQLVGLAAAARLVHAGLPARALRRGARRVASLQPLLSAGAARLGAAAALAVALHESLLEFRREGRRRVRGNKNNNNNNNNNNSGADHHGHISNSAAGIPAWRHAVLVAFAGAFPSDCADSFVPAQSTAAQQHGVVCAAVLSAAVIAAADEMRWHTARPSAQQHGGAVAVEALARHTHACESSVLFAVARALSPAAPQGHPRQAMALTDALRASGLVASVLSATRGRRPEDVALSRAAMAFLFEALAGLTQEPQPHVMREICTRVQELWAFAVSPRERRAGDAAMTHRTVHTALNLRFVRATEPGLECDGILTRPAEAAALLRCVCRAVDALAAWQTARGTISRAMAMPLAVLCRTVLDMEADLYFAACAATGREWTTPISIGGAEKTQRQRRGKDITRDEKIADEAMEKDDENKRAKANTKAEDKKDQTEDSWALVLRAAAELRVSSSALIGLYFRALVALELAATDHNREAQSFVQRSFYRFLSAIATSYYPLLRRHYLDSGDKEVLGDCLRTFVALKQASDVLDGDGDERRSGERVAFRVCGVNLAQAMEIAFFLTLHRDPAMDADIVPAYVKEVLFALDHNTAKQLWHLRAGKGVQRCFTGEDFEMTGDERMLRRYAQSTLSVVHAHVMHPSFLWMPLWQLQEMIFVLAHNRALLEEPVKSVDPSSGHDPTPAVVRVGSRGGVLRHFGRALGYVMLRLYVVSNVVRQYKSGLPGLSLRPPLSLPQVESAPEAARRRRRTWAKAAAARLRDAFPGLSATAEGIGHTEWAQRQRGGRRAIARLEATVQLAMRHRLLFDVRRRRRDHAVKAQAGKVKPSDEAEGEQKEEKQNEKNEESEENKKREKVEGCVTVRVYRADVATPLGFSLHGDSAAVRRITSADGAAVPTPFAQALRVAGVADASTVVGWRVLRVDEHEVETGRSVITLVKGKTEFTMTLVQPKGST